MYLPGAGAPASPPSIHLLFHVPIQKFEELLPIPMAASRFPGLQQNRGRAIIYFSCFRVTPKWSAS
jgi:hypothetical protein